MADAAKPAPNEARPPAPGTPAQAPRWKDVWQLPVLGLGSIALIAGLVVTIRSAPKPDIGAEVKRASRQVEAKEYGPALDTLNKRVLPYVNRRTLNADQEREFFLLRARALAMGQKDAGIDRADNNNAIVAEYAEAQRRNAELDDRDHYLLGLCYASLGKLDEASRELGLISPAGKSLRTELLRRLIDLTLAAGTQDSRALDLLAEMTADPDATDTDRLWALARQARLLVKQGYVAEAIDKSVRAILKARDPDRSALAEAYIELGAAYLANDAADEAKDKLELAARLLSHESPLMARIGLMLGKIEHHDGALDAARDQYLNVVDNYTFSDDAPEALLGLAEVLAQKANLDSQPQDEAVERYTQLVTMLLEGAKNPGATPDRVGDSLLGRFAEQVAKGDNATAERYAALGEKLFGIDKGPPELLRALALVHRKLAEEILARAGGDGVSLLALDPADQREARMHLVRAGGYSRSYARRVVESDPQAQAGAIWDAAEDFDRAGDLDDAATTFREFATQFPSDKRQPLARFRLAQSFQARGDLDQAAREYRAIIGDRDAQPNPTGALADQCFVPLAQTLLMDGNPSNDPDAEQLLHAVLNGAVGSSEAPAYREALLAMGDYSYKAGLYEQAITAYDEYLQRLGPAAAGTEETQYKLGDAYRMSATEMAKTLATSLPEEEAKTLDLARRERLSRAMNCFDRAIAALQSSQHRSAIQDLYLRNASFYLADCAFDLKDYETAIRLYDAAKDRYAGSPASLVAMTQIVSALLAQGQTEKARTANDRAIRFFNSLPESAWDDPALPMTRQGWERWLKSQEMLGTYAKAEDQRN